MTTVSSGGRRAALLVRARPRLSAWLFGLCLLMLSSLAHASNCPPQSITVASGGTRITDLSNCSASGISGYQTPPQHGINDSRNNNSTGLVYYTNNGDSSTTDSFSVIDGDDNSVIPFTVTVQQAGPSVTTTTFPDAAVGSTYSQSLAASGGSTPYTWSLTGGALPAGLVLSSAGGVSGTPSQAGSFNPVFTVTDSANRTASRTIALNVSGPTLSITPTTLPNPVIEVAYSQALGTSGGIAPYTYLIAGGALPPGITLSSSGNVSGNATTPGTFNFTVRSTDSSTGTGAPFSTTRTYSVTISPPTITVAPATLPNPTVGVAYSQTVSASGGTAPYIFAITAGALPAGMSLASSGALNGTPTAAGTFNFTVTATDSSGFTGSRAYTITVAAPTIAIAPASLPNATAGQAYSATVTANGGTPAYSYAITAGSLPNGITMSQAGVISGTSTIAGSFNFTVTATDSSTGASAPFNGSRTYTLTVGAPTVVVAPTTLPNLTVGAAYSQNVSASGGTAPYTFAVTAGATPAGVTLSTAGVLSGTPTAAGTFNFTVTATDSGGFTGNRAYTVTVAAPTIAIAPTSLPNAVAGQAYSSTVTASGGTAPYSFAVTGGSLPSGITLSSTGVLSGTSTVAGTFNFTVSATDSSSGAGAPFSGSRAYSLTVGAPSVVVAPATLPNPIVGTAYSQNVTASGGTAPYTFAVTAGAMPAGVTLNAAGALSGTPTAAGTFNFTVTATDGNGFDGARAYTVTVAAPTIAIAPTSLPSAVAGQAYSSTVTASGGTAPYSFAVTTGSLPSGITLSATGVLSGASTVAGTFNFTVTATDSSRGTGAPFRGSRAYSLTVGAPSVVVAPATLPNPIVGTAYSQNVTASGGTAPYTFAVTAGAMPAGVTLNAAGALSGTPTAAGTFNFTVTATDGNGFDGARAYTVTVATPTITVTPTSLPSAVAGQAYSGTVTASGGTAPYSFAVTAGSLPSGITLSSTGVLSGTSTVAGAFNFTVTATDSSSGAGAPFSSARAYTLSVGSPAITVAPATLPNPTVGAAYSQTVTASGGTAPYTFAITGGALPAGMSLASSGTLSGTPTAAGTFNVTITATDGNGFNNSRAYVVIVGGPALVLTPTSQPAGHVAQAYSASFSTTGGTAPYHYTATGTLPAGLALADNGTLGGTPTQAGNFPVAIHVTDSSTGPGSPFSATLNVTLAVDADPLALMPASPALTATYGVGNSIAFTSSGGSAPRTLSLTGTLPAGMTFDATAGVLSGTPTVTGSFPFTVTVTDNSVTPATLSRNYTLTIAAVTVVVTPTTLPTGTVGTAYSGSLSASGGAAPYAFAISAGALPQGLTLSTAGTLSGTPTQNGPASFTVRATDANGMAGVQAYSVTIGDAVPVAVPDTATTAANQSVTIPVTTNDSGVITSVAVATAPAHGAAIVDGVSVRYTPTANFFGSDSFTYTAIGPGGRSNPATVTVTVQAGALPVVPDQAVTVLAGQSVSVNATSGASGGPFTSVTLVTQPTAGTATVSGTTITYSAPANADGVQRFAYTVTNVFGVSQPATVTVTVQPRPVAVALTASVGAGQSVQVDLTSAARGGPFTDAAVVSLSPAQAGMAAIVKTASGYRLDFTAATTFSGQAQLVYTLSNAYAMSQPATVTISVTARPDPSKDAEVTGLLGAQVDATRRMASGQISNFQQRLESLHGAGSSRFSNGLSFSSAGGRQDMDVNRPGIGVAEATNHPDAATFLKPGSAPTPVETAQASPDDVAFWTGGAVNFGATERGAATNGVDFTTSGVSMGADKRFSNILTLGLGVGYGHDADNVGKMGSRSTTTAYNMALYASLRPTDTTYLDTLIGYQWLDFDARRYVSADGNRVTGSRDGKQTFASMAFGYEHDNGTTRLTPYGRLDIAQAQLDGYTEHGDATYALNYRGQTVSTSTGALGLRAEFHFKRDFGLLTPNVRLEYQRDFQGISSAQMSYADFLNGPLYRADVGDTARNHALLGFGIQAQFNNGLILREEYQALFDSGTHANQSILLGIEKSL